MTDPDAHVADRLLGPIGARARYAEPVRVGLGYAVLAALPVLAGLGRIQYCLSHGWVGTEPMARMCYSDMANAVATTSLTSGPLAYLRDEVPIDQPILSGLLMSTIGGLVGGGDVLDAQRGFMATWAVLAALALALMVWLATRTPGHPSARPLALALSPVVALTVFLAPDLLGVTLCTVGVWLWLRGRPGIAGAVLGAAFMARTYPVLAVLLLVLIAVRHGDRHGLGRLLQGFAAAVAGSLLLAVMSPDIAIQAWRAWFGASTNLGSPWHIATMAGVAVPPLVATALAVLGWIVAGLLGAALVLGVRRPPPVFAILLVVVAVVLVTGKSFPLQASLWLVPLVALAGLAWRDILWWWAAEAAHFVALWLYVGGLQDNPERGLPAGWYAVFLVLRLVAICWLVWVVWSRAVAGSRAPRRARPRRAPAPTAAAPPADVVPD